jgi:SP family galactose:H+ symporter-like MFS transporter
MQARVAQRRERALEKGAATVSLESTHKHIWLAAAAPLSSERRPRFNRWLALVAAVVCSAGLLFGYDQGVIGGALSGIERTFRATTVLIEVVTSWVTLGALLGALVAGALADKLGRRITILVGAVVFLVGVAVETWAPMSWVLVVSRLTLGAGVGIASVAAPLYASEVASTRWRGRLVSTYQLAVTVGIFFAFLVDQMLATSGNWRLMLGLSAIPGFLLVFTMLPLPDSPVWYLEDGAPQAAQEAFHKLRPDESAADTLAAVEAHLGSRKDSWSEVFARRWRQPLIVGVGLAVLQQLTGINAIIYYADKIFAAAGFVSPADQTAATTWSIGAVNVLFTFIAVLYVDRLGRRPLLLAGLIGMAASLVAVGACFRSLGHTRITSPSLANHPTDVGVITLVALVVFIAAFAFSLGPVVWTVISEIYPSRVRGRGVAVATAANWLTTWLVSRSSSASSKRSASRRPSGSSPPCA